jgi:hypothetical protein
LAEALRQDVTRAAERILSEAFGGSVCLSQAAEPLSSSRRSMVVWCCVLDAPSGAPASVVIKQVADEERRAFDPGAADHGSPARRFFNEWAGTEFLSRVLLAPQSPRFYGGDGRLGLIVLEDVGKGVSVQDLMSMTIRARFDGKVIIPDEPVELPVGQPLQIEVSAASAEYSALTPEERRAALDRLIARAIPGLSIPDEALRRENLYADECLSVEHAPDRLGADEERRQFSPAPPTRRLVPFLGPRQPV